MPRNHVIPLEKKLWDKVDKSGECWLWLGSTSHGYGRIIHNGKNLGVHRISWELAFGPIPEGMDVCHNCPGGDNPRCVKPTHLWLGTHAENMRDRDIKHLEKPFVLKGEANPRSKFTESDIIEIRKLYQQGATLRGLGGQFGVSSTAIYYIISRKRWEHVA